MENSPSVIEPLARSRGWLIAGGILSLLVGILAITFPLLFTIVIEQLLGAIALVSGVIALGVAIFGKQVTHRWINALSGLVRIAAGLVLLAFVPAGVGAVTLVLAILFLVEGFLCIVGALKLRAHQAWEWLLLNGIAALALGLIIFLQWPGNIGWVLGLLYGINSLFAGVSLLMFAFRSPRPSGAVAQPA